MELAVTSWLAHQINVRVARVFCVSAFTADINADSSAKVNQKWKIKDVNDDYKTINILITILIQIKIYMVQISLK